MGHIADVVRRVLAHVGGINGIVSIFSIIAGTAGIINIKNFIAKERENKKNERKHKLKEAITEFNQYKEANNLLFKYYSKDIEVLKSKGYELIDVGYFEKIFNGKISFKEDKSLYRFPVLYKENWLKSHNNELQIKLEKLQKDGKKNYLIPLSDKFLERFGFSGYEDYIYFLQNDCKKKLWNSDTYDLYRIEENDNTLTFSCCMGNYFNFIRTYELIQEELYYNYIYRKNKFILRKKIKLDNLTDYSSRPVKIGINVFTIMKKSRGYSTFIHSRKSGPAEYAGFKHVTPAGTFQPLKKGHEKEQYLFEFTVLRELLEELFDMEKNVNEHNGVNPMGIFSLEIKGTERSEEPIRLKELLFDDKLTLNKNLSEIKKEDKKYELIPTGFLIDIASLKPELTFILYLKDGEINEKLSNYLKISWEGDIEEYNLSPNAKDKNFFKFLTDDFNIKTFTPAGAVAISEGIKWYMENLAKQNSDNI